MKIAISLPDDLFEAAEAEAERMGVSRSKLHQLALEQYLKLAKSDEIKRRLTESYTRSPEPVDPFIQALADETMRRMEWEDEEGRRVVGKPRRAARGRARVSTPRRHHLGK
ncbi:MAG: hypothetical protein ACT4N2_09805 [Hyphomicrobium sp.]